MKRLRSLLPFLLVSFAGCEEDYVKIMQDKFQKIFQTDGYTFFGYPTNNFGVGTIYAMTSANDKPNDGNFWCDAEFCLGLNKPGGTPMDWLELGGFAAVGQNGGTVTFTESQQTDISAKVVMPQVYEMLKLGGSADYKRGVKVTVQLDQAFPRKLRRQPTIDFLRKLPDDNDLKKKFQQGALAIVVADIVVKSMSVSICVDTSKNAGLDTALNGSVGKVLGDGASLQVSISKSTSGCYGLVTTRPVIVAARAARQPGAGVLEATDDDWKDFTPTGLQIPKQGTVLHSH